jgi:hypothetical protein
MGVSRWAAWPSAQPPAAASPDVAFIDASLRRRLGPLARMMLHVARECIADTGPARLVFASRHGELGYTVSLLSALAAAEPLSPTAFSLSVHNAAAGLFSTSRRDRSASTAIAAGPETLGQALVEAHGQLACDPGESVLVVYGDCPLPEEYAEFEEVSDRSHGRALALLLGKAPARRVDISVCPAQDEAASAITQAESFLARLETDAPARWVGAGKAWAWH